MDLSIPLAFVSYYANIMAHRAQGGTGLNPLAKKRKLDKRLSGSALGSHDQTEFSPRFLSRIPQCATMSMACPNRNLKR
jgi:hypothetical protein